MKKLTFQAMILALYVVLTVAISPIAFGVIQVRVSTGLYALAFYYPELILPLTVANFLANLQSPFGVVDWIIGPIIGFIVTYWISRLNTKWVVPIPIIIVPTLFVSVMLHQLIHVPLFSTMLYVGLGQAISGTVFGLLFLKVIERAGKYISV